MMIAAGYHSPKMNEYKIVEGVCVKVIVLIKIDICAPGVVSRAFSVVVKVCKTALESYPITSQKVTCVDSKTPTQFVGSSRWS